MAIRIETPLGRDALLVTGLTGDEALSRPFRLEVEAVAAEGRAIPFDALLGRPATVVVELAGRAPRFFSGICSRVSQAARASYALEVVPQFWLLTRSARSRIFQERTVPEILQEVLAGLDVSFELARAAERREFVVQYRESDFDFASRLMEEEGIFYFFRHAAGRHELVVADSPASHPELPGLEFDPKARPGTVFEWEKRQELRSGKVTLRDFGFETPGTVEFSATTLPAVQVGGVEHRLLLPANEQLELVDFTRASDALAAIRMEEEAAHALRIEGASTAPSLTSGHRFALRQHFDGDGQYVVVGVTHAATQPDPRKDKGGYRNTFTCIPAGLPFRPPRVTPKPAIGTQSAFVTGPAGTSVHSDPLGRVKVQFHWDREGRNDENSSVWIRVAQNLTPADGRTFFLPEVGDEVLVAFEHGDPDRPVIVGSLWNGRDRPPDDDEGGNQ